MKKRNNKIRQTNLGTGIKVNSSQIGRYNRQYFCTGDNKNTIQIWSFEEQKPVQTLLPSVNQASQTQVSALTFTNDENGIVSGSNRGIINIWDLETAKISCTLKGHSAPVNTFTTFVNDDIRLASGSYDTNIKLWDLRTRDSKITLKGHTKQVNSLDISPDDKLLISGSEDGTVKLWDVRFPEKIITTYTQHAGPINCVKFNPEDIMFASAGADRTAKYFQCEPGMYVYISTTDINTSAITAIQFSNDGSLLYTASNDSLKLWKMGKDGMLVDTVDSSWKGVQDLCMIDDTLVGIAFHNGLLSFWAYETNQKGYSSDEKPKTKNEEKEKNSIKNNRSEDLRDARNNVNLAMNKINDLQKRQAFKKNQSVTEQVGSKQQPKKKNFLEEMQRKKVQEERKKQQQRVIKEEIERMEIEQKRKRQELRIKKEEEDKARKESLEKARKQKILEQQMEAKRLEQLKNEQQIAKFNEDMAHQQQNRTEAHRLMQSVLYDQKLDATLNASQFMADDGQRQKFKQFDAINDILKQSGKFSEVLSFRLSRVKPIIKWWITNNIKSALYALNEAAASVVVDALNTIFNNGKMKSLVTLEVATALCRKSAQLILDKHSQYVRSGITITNEIVLMFKEDLIRIKNFNPGARVDLTRQERIVKYDKLIESFLGVFKMERVIKYSKNPSHELYQPAIILYKNLQEILKKWTAKSEAELVC